MAKIIVDKTIEEIKQILRDNYPTKESRRKFVVYHSNWIALRMKFKPHFGKIYIKEGCEFTPRAFAVLLLIFIFFWMLPPIIIGVFLAYWYYSYKFKKELAILIEYGE